MSARERLPHSLKPLASHDWEAITIGKSSASVWRIGLGDSALYLKAEPNHELAEMPQEVLRLDYLAEMGFPAPRIVDHVIADDFSWLLMTSVKGQDLTHLVERPIAGIILAITAAILIWNVIAALRQRKREKLRFETLATEGRE